MSRAWSSPTSPASTRAAGWASASRTSWNAGEKTVNQYGRFLCFEPLTWVPIATSPIVPGVLTRDQLDWLNAYHRRVFEQLAPRLTGEERDWLARKCAAIGA